MFFFRRDLYLGQETTKEVPFKLEAKCLDKTPKFRCRVAVILPREPTHLDTDMMISRHLLTIGMRDRNNGTFTHNDQQILQITLYEKNDISYQVIYL